MIIHNAAPQGEVYAHAYDAEFTVILADWCVPAPFLPPVRLSHLPPPPPHALTLRRYHKEHDVLAAKFLSKANPNGNEPVPGTHPLLFPSLLTPSP